MSQINHAYMSSERTVGQRMTADQSPNLELKTGRSIRSKHVRFQNLSKSESHLNFLIPSGHEISNILTNPPKPNVTNQEQTKSCLKIKNSQENLQQNSKRISISCDNVKINLEDPIYYYKTNPKDHSTRKSTRQQKSRKSSQFSIFSKHSNSFESVFEQGKSKNKWKPNYQNQINKDYFINENGHLNHRHWGIFSTSTLTGGHLKSLGLGGVSWYDFPGLKMMLFAGLSEKLFLFAY